MTDIHFPGHQQALIKDHKVIAVISFEEHNNFEETFSLFDYDDLVDLCVVQKDAILDSIWDGINFNIQPFDSWIIGDDLSWHPPVENPEQKLYWNEIQKSWIPVPKHDTEIQH